MKILVIYNNAPLYREAVFYQMDKELPCDWVFGEAIGGIKQMNIAKLRGKVKIVKNKALFKGKAYWQTSVLTYLRSDYTHYIILGDERCLSTWLFLLLSKFYPRKKMFLWTHGAYGKESLPIRVVEKLFYNLVDGTFLYGDYARDILIRRGFSPNKLHTIHNSLNYDQQLNLRKTDLFSDIYKKHFDNNDPVIVVIGRLNVRKKLPMLIDAVANLRKRGRYYNLVLIGSGDDKKELELRVNNHNIERYVWFYGACYDEKENAVLLTNADLCVLPGDIGLTAIHCMMFGVPVITHNAYCFQGPEFEAVKEGETGAFFDYDKQESLELTIEEWFAKKANQREEVRQACYKEIDTNWNPSNQIRIIKSVL